ncbi:group I intron endonuclease [Sanguibacter gelidistatuariae]|uniref:Group I intron endonuclease n=1 Tax=Sanguibacter gelidistatuariae TaxID=1814289 RepID=A0A1G6VKU6_9MICO|nr:NUMOD3 domain-containing DNA-binding protein [Sanguibacter gelidistatuariae]SDD53486.1 group I intron endonuclease [Sanguibacter gelidistatuariae]
MIAAEVPEVVGVVYGIRLRLSAEFRYVGITTKGARRRFLQHLRNARDGRKTPFYDWLRKHGRAELVVDVLETITGDLAELGKAECLWISQLREAGHDLLNLSEGGLGPTGVVWTDAQREAARIRSTDRPGVSRPGDLNPFFGHSHTDEQRQTWSESRRGTNVGPDNPNFGRFGPDHPSFGRVLSAESRRLLSEGRTGPLNPNFGKTASSETRALQSAAQKGVPKPSSVRSAHTRYHTNKGVVSPICKFCRESAVSDENSSESEKQ